MRDGNGGVSRETFAALSGLVHPVLALSALGSMQFSWQSGRSGRADVSRETREWKCFVAAIRSPLCGLYRYPDTDPPAWSVWHAFRVVGAHD